MSRHFNKAHKTTITDWQLDQKAHGLDATIGPGLRQGPYESGAQYPDTGESGETYDVEMAAINNSKPRK